MEKKKKSGFASSFVTIIILIIIVIFSNISGQKASYIENVINKIILPVQNVMTNLKEKISSNEIYLKNQSELEEENKKLKEENSRLLEENRELDSLKSENIELKQYMNLTQKYSEYKTVPAYIVNKDISNYSKILIINVGSKDGVEPNMTVIADQGLVGHIIEVSENSSKVLPLTDASSSVSCVMSTSKDSFISKGILDSNSELKAIYIPNNASVLVGDSIETSGIGGIYPKGIHIGTIKRIINTSNIVDRYALIEPSVDFDKLTCVLVVKN